MKGCTKLYTELDVLNGSKKILKKTKLVCIEVQCSKNEYENKVKKIEKLLGKDFDLIYKKRILIASLFTGIVSYDYIYSQKIWDYILIISIFLNFFNTRSSYIINF